MQASLCETCVWKREILTPRSRFLLCEQAQTDPHYPKYPRQPVLQCNAYRKKDEAEK